VISPVYGLLVIAIGVTMLLVGWHGARGLTIEPLPAAPWVPVGGAGGGGRTVA
jgi:hypothetical protein